jgi:hypothetical protein
MSSFFEDGNEIPFPLKAGRSRSRWKDNIVTLLCSVTIDGVWIEDRICWTLRYNA